MKTLLYILIFNLSAISFAQDPQLFENGWYLQKLIINGQDYFPPNNSEIQDVTLGILENPYYIRTLACSSIASEISVIDNESFQVMGFAIIPGDCILPETIDFQQHYFDDFFHLQVPHNFNYLVEPGANNTKILTLTNEDNYQAIYGNQPLATQDFKLNSISIFPNPVNSELFINSKNSVGNLILKIFNIEGKLLSTQNLEFEKQAAVNVSNLSSGIYFLNIEDENGNTTVKKFIKQ
ncbi:hypothetical protein Aeqsu_0976 [Aequorivita sublithincola DSM 14238]|uniref:Secretion system C-terminal sorting domain-containing protein n=1 Tax=Aequorivita sublithincola (strain DSM 14238 / LMG 21431 / ACAM 643 / 9-3) TaxID=746697 RepID=I3YU09_AEQSU|nr:T9SS type A sorting domain-containing protein [Aequorivita sublithincola]AFL80477.1 hypothetical protein Aeqsu_0976 [Aequorivita sublithincola DSM 14238]